VQVDPVKPTSKPHGTKRLKLEYDGLLSNFGLKFNLRHYVKGQVWWWGRGTRWPGWYIIAYLSAGPPAPSPPHCNKRSTPSAHHLGLTVINALTPPRTNFLTVIDSPTPLGTVYA